jgi:flavin-dependent dehydrogenase
MESFDAIIVGAGPAGSTAAYRLSRAGARVLLLDRERFPRDKPCGGGLTYRAVRELPVPVEPVVEDTVHRFQLGFRYARRFERHTEAPLILMTQRRRLDAHLAGQAAAAGPTFATESGRPRSSSRTTERSFASAARRRRRRSCSGPTG